MRCLDLFAGGCNGFGLAAQWMGWETVACVEIDKWNQKLLKQNFPKAQIYGDIREFNEREAVKYRGRIDLITGGFPCQPFSTAGKREGTNDDRYLWPEMLTTIRIIQPAFVIGENVVGLTSMEDGRTFDSILASLEDEGYTVESFILPACSVGAWHRRDRLWIIAYSSGTTESYRHRNNKGQERESTNTPQSEILQRERTTQNQATGINYKNGIASNVASEGLPNRRRSQMGEPSEEQKFERFCDITANIESIRIQTQEREIVFGCNPERSGQSYWQAEPGVGRMVSRLPNRTHRIKALGNAVVPQIPYEIYKAIEKTFYS